MMVLVLLVCGVVSEEGLGSLGRGIDWKGG